MNVSTDRTTNTALRNVLDFSGGLLRTLEYVRSGLVPADDSTRRVEIELARKVRLHAAVALEYSEAVA
jgi:hypothetical protein